LNGGDHSDKQFQGWTEQHKTVWFFFSFSFSLGNMYGKYTKKEHGFFLVVRVVKVKYSRQCFPIGQQHQTQEPVSCSATLIVGVEKGGGGGISHHVKS
jgi:hypothetical protein